MKEIIFTFSFLAIITFSALAQKYDGAQRKKPDENKSPAGKIKKITGWLYDEGRKDTVVASFQRYNEKGQLIETGEPLYYCGETMEYDSLGRLSMKEVMCGESSGNGNYYYKYDSNSVCIEFSGPMWDSRQCDEYNSKGKIIHSSYENKEINYETEQIRSKSFSYSDYTYLYNKKGQIEVEKEFLKSFYFDLEEAIYSDTTTQETTTYYYYADFDSLVSLIQMEGSGEITKRKVFIYDPITHLKTDEFYIGSDMISFNNKSLADDFIEAFGHTVYMYDKNGKLASRKFYTCNGETTIKPTMTLTGYDEYKDGLLDESFTFHPDNGSVDETIWYTYEYWD
jgi:hypothetical protein